MEDDTRIHCEVSDGSELICRRDFAGNKPSLNVGKKFPRWGIFWLVPLEQERDCRREWVVLI
jgi:hypothetical protein